MSRLVALGMPVLIAGIAWGASAGCGGNDTKTETTEETTVAAEEILTEGDSLTVDSVEPFTEAVTPTRPLTVVEEIDSLMAAEADSPDRYRTLTDDDLRLVADELGIEVAAIKAVVSIEAGAAMEGFAAPGVPIINYDPSMYKVYGPKAPSKKGNPNAKVPSGLKGYQLKEWTQLTNARKKNAQGADMGTFWGMFQIGGFNYKVCGCETVDEFVEKMSYSELSQLQLFAKFLLGTGQIKYLRNKDWTGFARAYNGKSYAKRKYHTRMANAYKKFSQQK